MKPLNAIEDARYSLKKIKTLENFRRRKYNHLRWLNTVLRAVNGNSRDKQTGQRKKQWYTEEDLSKSTH